MFTADRLTKLYGIVVGVNDFTVDVGQGSYGLLGPNGSGKTTLLNLMTGQLKPTVGALHVAGEIPWKNNRLLEKIGFCSALDILQTKRSGLEWVTLYTEMVGYRHAIALDLAHTALDRVGLSRADRVRGIDQYSRGMKQRCKVAQAIAHEPELLLLDEPFAGLDPIARYELTSLLTNWVQEGRGLIVSSHILHEVEMICENFLLMMNGRLLADGNVNEIQSMLSDLPRKVWIRAERSTDLAIALQASGTVDSISFHDDSGGLEITTFDAVLFGQNFAAMILDKGIEVTELHSEDDSLDSVFEILMRIHRGEA